MLRGTAGGEGDTLIRFLCCGYFLTPPSCGHLPYILYCKTQGRRLIPYDVSCLSFTPPPIFPYGNTPQCYGTRQGEAENFLLCEFSRAALFFCLIEKPDIKDYRLYRSISSMMSRRLYSRGILCCPPSLLWSRNQASNIPVLAGMISRHSSAILLNRLAS